MPATALDLQNQAALFDDVADDILAYRKQNSATLSDPLKLQLTMLFGQILQISEQLEDQAVELAMDDIGASVADLQDATHQADHALQVIKDVTEVISIAAAAVGLGAALLAPTPEGVAGALNTLVTAVSSALQPDPAAQGAVGGGGN